MPTLNFFKSLIGIVALSAAMPVLAEAPVYDAESLPQDQEMGSSDQAQYYPPPPSPDQQEGATFVPMQSSNTAAMPAASAPSVSSPAVSSMNAEQRLQRLEQQLNNMQASDSGTRVDSLQNQVQGLRNQIEILTHQLEQLQNQLKSQYSDLDKRLNQSSVADNKSLAKTQAENKKSEAVMVNDESLTSPAVIKTNKKGKRSKQVIAAADNLNPLNDKPAYTQPNVAEEQQIYQTAYNLIKSKKYDEAVSALQGMLKRYPSGQFASNAHYWLGELYGLMGKSDQALKEFNSVVHAYPDSPRVSDAQLKVGLILASELKWPDAKIALKQVINHYPGSASARLAAEQLKQIKQAGH